MDSISPKLIEFGTMEYMQNILSNCHKTRVNIYLYVLNIGVFILFVGGVLFILYYSYKSKNTPEETYQKKIREQEYVLSKIKVYKEHQQHIARSAGFTTLPITDSAFNQSNKGSI